MTYYFMACLSTTLYTISARFYAELLTLERAFLRGALNPRTRDFTRSAQLSNAGKDATRSAKASVPQG